MNVEQKGMKQKKDGNNFIHNIIKDKSPLYPIYLEKLEDKNNYIMESAEAKCFMHSIYSVENEIDMMFKKVPKDVDTIILFGVGSGKAIEYINKSYTNLSEIILIEPSLQIFNNYIESGKAFDRINENINITLLVNKDEITTSKHIVGRLIHSRRASFATHISYSSVFATYYQKILKETGETLKVQRGGIGAISGQWKAWLLNGIKNLQNEAIALEKLGDIFKNRTAVLVSAGPSLNKNMHLIPILKEKAIVVAVGSAIKILDSHGIEPHFRVAIDGLPREKVFLEGIDTERIPLIFGNHLYYEILPEYQGKKIRMNLESDPMGRYLYEKMDIPYKTISSGASVANGTLDFMCKFGVKRVIFMGQDLSYTEEGFHAKGTNTKGEEGTFINLDDYIEMNNIYGEKVYTIDPFLQIKYVLEDRIKENDHIEFINATEGGLSIDGTNNLALQEILDNHLKGTSSINIEKEFKAIVDEEDMQVEYNSKLRTGIETIKEELIEVKKVHDKIMEYLIRLRKLKEKNASMNRISNDLTYITSLEKQIEGLPIYSNLVLESLKVDIIAISARLGYKGNDRRKKLETRENIISNKMVKIKEFLDFAMFFLEDENIKIEFKEEEGVE